jgi:glutaminyl-tRNA synthetase
MYDFAHGQSDSIEGITHSLCSQEYEDHRPLYDWFLEALEIYHPRQIEFARLNLTYTVMSKRKLRRLVQEGHVSGWDDPRMPTLVGGRRRGYTPGGFRLLAERVGVSKAHQVIDFSVLEDCMRDDLNEIAPRRMAVLEPIKLVIENYAADKAEQLQLPNHPQKPDWGKREAPFGQELWIEREDFQQQPEKGYFRLFPGNDVRLRFGYVVKCIGMKDGAVHATYYPDSRSGTPGADKYKVKGNIHWVSARHAHAAEVRLYDRLFKVPEPGTEREFLEDLNPASVTTVQAQLEPSLAASKPEERFQFERHGYFVRDRDGGFNRTVTLRDSWKK